MKTSTIRVLALFGLIATLGPLAVMAKEPYRFTIPFGFTVDTKSFAPGNYRIAELAPHIIQIRSEDGHVNVLSTGSTDKPLKDGGGLAILTFHRYGERYFLSKLADSGGGLALPKSAGEKELIANQAPTKPFDVVASSRR